MFRFAAVVTLLTFGNFLAREAMAAPHYEVPYEGKVTVPISVTSPGSVVTGTTLWNVRVQGCDNHATTATCGPGMYGAVVTAPAIFGRTGKLTVKGALAATLSTPSIMDAYFRYQTGLCVAGSHGWSKEGKYVCTNHPDFENANCPSPNVPPFQPGC